MQTIACETPTIQAGSMSPHVRELLLAKWMDSKPRGTFISTLNGQAWQRNPGDGFYYVVGSDAGFNVECVAMEGPFLFVAHPGNR